jgi:hypothetical protein
MKIDTTRHMKILLPLLFLLVGSTAFAQSPAEYVFGLSIEKTSEQFLSVPYCGDALGEGGSGKFDQDPLCRTDGFDCQTFVETVIVMSRATDQKSFESEMNKIRYAMGKPAYEMRLHFSETQWIPENQRRGYFKDITEDFLPCVEQDVTVDMNKWYRAKTMENLNVANRSEDLLEEFQTLAADIEPESIAFTYLRVADIDEEILQAIPSESIIVFVKKNTSSVGADPIMVTHMGLVIDTPNGKVLRHATPMKDYKKVTDISLAEYIIKFKSQATAEKFPAVGIKILKITK